MKNDFGIYGAGGMGKECVWIANSNLLNLNLKYFYDENPNIINCAGVPIIKKLNHTNPVIVSIAEPKIRKEIVIKHLGLSAFTNLISNTSKIHASAKIGNGCILGFDSIISVDVKIANHCLVNTRTIIGHDSTIEDFVSLMYNVSISGNVKIKEGTLIGTGAIILPNITIGKWCKIGAGAVVTKDIPDYSVVVGVPGKIIKTLEPYE
jgi:sugar O-acyltransferase (sialic acid O-acetyltransferase NeuD family)